MNRKHTIWKPGSGSYSEFVRVALIHLDKFPSVGSIDVLVGAPLALMNEARYVDYSTEQLHNGVRFRR